MNVPRSLVWIAILALATARICAGTCANERMQVVLTFAKPYEAYRAMCTIAYLGPLTIAVEKSGLLLRRFTLKTLTEPIDIRPVRFQARRGPDVQGLFVRCLGGSAYHDYVFEITPNPPSGKELMYGLDKGGVDYGYDSKGRLKGLRFHYQRWHMDTDSGLRGHVFTAIDYTWLPGRQAFRQGGVHVDREREAKAGLLDILQAIGAGYYLPMAYSTEYRLPFTCVYSLFILQDTHTTGGTEDGEQVNRRHVEGLASPGG